MAPRSDHVVDAAAGVVTVDLETEVEAVTPTSSHQERDLDTPIIAVATFRETFE